MSIAGTIFFLGAVFSLSPWCSPPIALILGAALALSLGNPYPAQSKKVSRILLQVAVVLLGFSLDLGTVLEAGQRGLAFALVSITSVFVLGWMLQKALKVRPVTSCLVSTGTAICGGSAIAAMSTVLDAPQEDISVSVGTVFLLNALGLVIFPPIGHALALTGQQFGMWAGIAIHDVSSVVGAASTYGGGALATATAVKLSRVLYLIPITLLAAWGQKSKASGTRVPIPWFIGLFLIACLAHSFFEPVRSSEAAIKQTATAGFCLSLYLIGSGLTAKTLKQVGYRPLLQGVLLWVFIGVASLAFVKGLF